MADVQPPAAEDGRPGRQPGDPAPPPQQPPPQQRPVPPRPAAPAAATQTNGGGVFNRARSVIMTALSFVLTLLVVGNAYAQRQQFYPSVVYITKSNPSMAVLYVQAFVFVVLFGKLVRKIFFGRLRAAEFEHLMERSWYAVTETCLAFTVFKDDFSPKFVALFTLLLFLKSFHWLAEDRVDFMERSPSISFLFHVRVISLNLLLAALDIQFIMFAYTSTLTKGPSVQLVFGFEYAVLLTIVANTLVKYVLHAIDLYSENPWENKAVFMLYTELVIGFVKVILYLVFIGIMIRIYTLPLFAVRPMYLTMRAFKKALNDVILSRRAIFNMNTYYPDATEEELANSDNVCIICRDEMTTPSSTKKLPCGHIFHKNCLRSWFQRQQTCPTCRLDVLRSAPRQQQQQQAQQRNLNNNINNAANNPFADINNIFAQMAAAGNLPFPPAPPGQRQQQPQQAGQQQQQQQQQQPSSGGQQQPNVRPPFPPPPPMPFFNPFMVPPPMPPPDFSGMTTEELRAMEGDERENVEARIRCLRNIQVLLDAAVMEMQQYSNVVGALNRSATNRQTSASTAVPASATTAPASSASSPATSSTSAPADAPTATAPTAATGAIPKTTATPKAEDKSGEGELIRRMDAGLEDAKKEDSESTSATTNGDQNDDQDEIRRRRLARFQS